MAGNPELRSRLQWITDQDPRVRSTHPTLALNVAKHHSHSIRHVDPCDEGPSFNCFQFAFGLKDSTVVVDLLTTDRDQGFPLGLTFGAEFVERLIDRELLVVDAEGDLLAYFADARPAHAGLIDEHDRVTSKWGDGHLWNHEIWEVPSSYGDCYERYSAKESGLVEEEFRIYEKELRERLNSTSAESTDP